MSLVAILMAPLVMLLPAAGSVDPAPELSEPVSIDPQLPGDRLGRPSAPIDPAAWPAFEQIAESFRADTANQVRIEQHTTIRIVPRQAAPRATMLMDLPRGELPPRLTERNAGRCLPVGGIAGVQVDRSDKLILFMRDRRIMTAQLERSCRARDFYSGFYVDRNSDGRLCVG